MYTTFIAANAIFSKYVKLNFFFFFKHAYFVFGSACESRASTTRVGARSSFAATAHWTRLWPEPVTAGRPLRNTSDTASYYTRPKVRPCGDCLSIQWRAAASVCGVQSHVVVGARDKGRRKGKRRRQILRRSRSSTGFINRTRIIIIIIVVTRTCRKFAIDQIGKKYIYITIFTRPGLEIALYTCSGVFNLLRRQPTYHCETISRALYTVIKSSFQRYGYY